MSDDVPGEVVRFTMLHFAALLDDFPDCGPMPFMLPSALAASIAIGHGGGAVNVNLALRDRRLVGYP